MLQPLLYLADYQETVIGVTQPPPKDGAWSALLHSNLSQT